MIIFSQGWSVGKDGPGQRLVFYLKGCNMRCLWCASPESLKSEPEIMFYPARSSKQVDFVCPYGAVNGENLNREICGECKTRDCITTWKNPCFELAGREITPEDILKEALDGRGFFGAEGGVTFGGGEPALQINQLLDTVDLLRANLINTAVETNASATGFPRLIGKVDYMMCDLKAVTPETHRRMTGISSEPVLDNLRLACAGQRNFQLCFPVVPEHNNTPGELNAVINFCLELKILRKKSLELPLRLELVRIAHLGEPKYYALGAAYPMRGHPLATEQDMAKVEKIFKENSLEVRGIS